MKVKSPEEITIMREGGKHLSSILRQVASAVRVGIETRELDTLALRLITETGDIPAFLHYKADFSRKAYPATLCVSINDEVVHGVPGKRKLENGDIVGLDLGLQHRGLFVDMAVTVPVGKISETDERLIQITKEALRVGLASARSGVRLGDVGVEIERVAETAGFSVVRELGGHGVGHKIHEAPFVPHFGPRGKGEKLEVGQTICIEPMVNVGGPGVTFDQDDGYTVRTADGSRSAHYEVTLAVTDKGIDVLTPIFW
ncbi:MAG TPA: type I methionyl aminopeptidase [Candidatus Paceibacterota bacterium]